MKMLPCPFCGGKAKAAFMEDAKPELPNGFWHVSCGGPRHGCGGQPMSHGDTKAEAIENWNRRGAPGWEDHRVITINGLPITTTVDDSGVQRLPKCPHIEALFVCSALDLNKLAAAVKRDKSCPEQTRRWLYQRFGYSLAGYEEIFPNDEIVNPLHEAASAK